MASHSVVLVKDVEKSYAAGGDQPVLRGVNLEVRSGEFIALMGSSGSGKTTLLNLIGGLDTVDAGRIEVDGEDLSRLSDSARSHFRLRRIGFVFQFFNLLPNLTVRENIALPLLLLGEREGGAAASAEKAAAEVGLGDKTGRMAHQLSGGEMQRVGIARALVHGPGLLLADEPTGNLDSRTGAAILDLLRAIRDNHRLTVIMATHDSDAAAASGRIVHMVDGRITEGV